MFKNNKDPSFNIFVFHIFESIEIVSIRSSFPEFSLPEGAGGAEAAARRNSARLKIKDWVQYYFVQKPSKLSPCIALGNFVYIFVEQLEFTKPSLPELSLPEGAGGVEAAARRNSARLKIKGWVQSYFVQKPFKANKDPSF